jgi:uncharacterized protein YhfF
LRVGAFGDSVALSEQLLALIANGRKRAGASLLWAHEAEGEALPRPGEIEIIVSHRNEAAIIVRFTNVVVVPFIAVDAEFAASEGEGDGTLDYWRLAHWTYFCRECERIARTPSETMPVVCSVFEVLSVLPQSRAN